MMMISFPSSTHAGVQLDNIVFYTGPPCKKSNDSVPTDADEWADIDEILVKATQDDWASIEHFDFDAQIGTHGDGFIAGIESESGMLAALPAMDSRQIETVGNTTSCDPRGVGLSGRMNAQGITLADSAKAQALEGEYTDGNAHQNADGVEIDICFGQSDDYIISTRSASPAMAPPCPESPSAGERDTQRPAKSHHDLAEPERGNCEPFGNEQARTCCTRETRKHASRVRVGDTMSIQETAPRDEGQTDVNSSDSASRRAVVDSNESIGETDTDQDESDEPILPGWRRKGCPHPLTPQSQAQSPSPSRRRYQQGRKAQQTFSTSNCDVSHRANTAATTKTGLSSLLSIRQPKLKRRGRKPKWMAPLNPEAAMRKQPPNKPAWAVDRIVGVVHENGKLYYQVRWEDTIEPAKNLQGCADTAIAEFHLRHLL